MLADALLFLAEHLTQHLWGRGAAIAGLALLEHALGEVGQHDRREHLQQHAGAVAAEAGGLAQRLFRARLLAAEHVAQDLAAIALRRTTTEHRTEDAADIESG